MPPLRVLHVVPDLPLRSGGPSRVIPQLCGALTAAGMEVSLYGLRKAGEPLSIHPCGQSYEVVLFSSGLGRLRAAHRLFCRIRALGRKFDLVHLHSLWNPVVTLAGAAARQAGIPYVLTPHGMLHSTCLRHHSTRKNLYRRLYDHKTVEGASRLHFLNAAEARESRQAWLRAPQHFLCPVGVDLDGTAVQRGEFRARFPELAERTILLFLGRLHRIKNLDLQLQALARLVGKYPMLTWVLIGPDQGEWSRLKAALTAARLESHAQWLGPMWGAERFQALADADVFLQTSFHECHSISVSEALAVGVPIVVTGTVNFDEVQACGAGRVVDSRAAAVAEAVDAILASREQAERMREAGRRYAGAQLTWPKVAARLRGFYEEVLGRR